MPKPSRGLPFLSESSSIELPYQAYPAHPADQAYFRSRRTSPILTVNPCRSKYSRIGIAYLRDVW